jgi:LacI family transcriptional regulator
MATTMKDVARRAGVDVSTVSLAINNDPRIRTETRERILSIAQELGYQKNHLARGLRSGKSFTIGAVVGATTTFWGEVLAGAQSVLAERDYHLLLDYAPDQGRREETQIFSLKAKRVDGLLIAPPDNDSPESGEHTAPIYDNLRTENTPFVFVDRFVPGLNADIVAADNLNAARIATEHLLGLGHERIVYLYAPHRMNTSQRERLQGYQDAMQRAGRRAQPWEVVHSYSERGEEGREAVRELLKSPEGKGVTAILAATDSTAMGVLRALHDAGKRVPDDISVVGFGGTFAADFTYRPLTTMRLPMRLLGAEAARLLFRRIEGDESPFEHLVLPTELVENGSTGPAPRT